MPGLIITADDFGLHEAVNRAVERAHREGVLTAASLMVSAPGAADAIDRARRLPRLRVGLHLTLADGSPALAPSAIPHLVDRHGRLDDRMVRAGVRFFFRPAARRELAAEIRAQFEAYARSGLELDHVNAHKHFHLHPTVLSLILAIGRDYGLRAVRLPWESPVAPGLWPWLVLLRRRLRAARIASNDRLIGLAQTGRMDEPALLAALSRLPRTGVTEIYLHPASASGGTIAPTMSDYRHADELAALLAPAVRLAVDALGMPLGGYRDLFPAAGR